MEKNKVHLPSLAKNLLRAINQYSLMTRTDIDGCILEVNENFIRASGYSREETLGKTHKLLNSGYHPESFFKAMWQTVAKGEVWRGIIRNQSKSGEYYWVDTTIIPEYNEKGKVESYLSFRYDITLQVEQKRELGQQKDFFETILNNMQEGYVVQDQTGRVIRHNASSERILALSNDELTGRSSFDPRWQCFYPDGRPYPGEDHPAMRCLKTGKVICDEQMAIATPDGQYKWIMINSVPVFGLKKEKPDFAITTFSDITEIVEKNESIKKSARQFHKVSELAKIGVWSLNVLTGEGEWSEELFHIAGLPFSDKAPDMARLSILVHPSDLKRLLAAQEKVINTGQQVMVRYRLLVAGVTKHLESHIQVLRKNEDNKVEWLFGTSQDISEISELKEALDLEEKRLKLAMSAAGVGIWQWDISSGTLNWEQSMYDMYGIEGEIPGDKLYETWVSHVHPVDKPRILKELQTALDGGKPYDTYFRIITAGKQEKMIKAQSTIIRDKKGKAELMIGINIDDSERHQRELLLKKEKKRAEEATRTKSHFLASMSHEIRTPLNGIIGMLDLLKETDLNEKQKEMVEIIGGSGEHLLHLLNDILNFSKIESRGVHLEYQSFHVRDILEKLSLSFREQARKKKIAFTFDFMHKGHDVFISDKIKLQQILINLLSNAIKFTEQGDVLFRVESREIRERPGHLFFQFSVKDSGIGISKVDQEKLFHAFTQANEGIHRKYGGSGLGLVISNRLAEKLGGQIKFESVEGLGSSFRLELALEKAGTKEKTSDLGSNNPHSFSNKRFLIAEDNAVNMKLVKLLFETISPQVDLVSNGRDALKASFKKDYDLIFMDIQMPEMDGVEACKAILNKKPDQKIVAMTANVYSEDQKRYREAGMVDFIGKPIRKELLLELIHRNISEAIN